MLLLSLLSLVLVIPARAINTRKSLRGVKLRGRKEGGIFANSMAVFVENQENHLTNY